MYAKLYCTSTGTERLTGNVALAATAVPRQEWSLVQIKEINWVTSCNNPLHVTTGAFVNVHAFTAARARARVVTGLRC